jgi:hypothetical protein
MNKETNTENKPINPELRKTADRRSNFIIKSVFIENKEYKVENGFMMYDINDAVKNMHQY